MAFNVESVRRQFPFFRQEHPPVYLDTAASAQKPTVVLEVMRKFSETDYANVHRGMHGLADAATKAYEDARATVRNFINAKHLEEIIFTKGSTEGVNTVAHGIAAELEPGDGILLTLLEHHSNIVPWQKIAKEKDLTIHWVDITDEGELRMDQLKEILAKERIKIVAISALSNVLGVRTDVPEIIKLAHAAGAKVLVDAAQSVGHEKTDVQKLDCDFLVFSGHKLYGPTGIGVLYGKRELLKTMQPFQFGGGMVENVDLEGFTCADLPQKFEAGTPPIVQAIGLGAAIAWGAQFDAIERSLHEQELIKHAYTLLQNIEGVRILGSQNPKNVTGCLSFTVEGIHAHDLTDLLGRNNVCMRAGHHCAQPLHNRLGANSSTRLSVGIYNTKEEIEICTRMIAEVRKQLTVTQ